jgi:hypothetical protein
MWQSEFQAPFREVSARVRQNAFYSIFRQFLFLAQSKLLTLKQNIFEYAERVFLAWYRALPIPRLRASSKP